MTVERARLKFVELLVHDFLQHQIVIRDFQNVPVMEDSELSGGERNRSDNRRGTVAQTDKVYMASEDLILKAAKAKN